MGKFGKNSTIEKLLTVLLPFIYMGFVQYTKDIEIKNDPKAGKTMLMHITPPTS